MLSALLARFGLALTQLALQQIQQLVQFQKLQASHQLPPKSSPSTLAQTECDPRQNLCSIHQISQDFGVDGVRFTLSATGQRTGANPNLSPLATTISTPTLPPRKPKWDQDDRDFLLQSANRPHNTESSNTRIRSFVEDANTIWRCAGALATDGRVSSSPGSASTRPRNVDALTSALMASTTSNFVKVDSLYSSAWILKICTGNNVCLYNPVMNPSPHSRHALPTCRRALTPIFRQICNLISPSTTLSLACATLPLATTYDESALDAASAGRKPFRWPKPAKFAEPPSTRW